MDYDRSQSINGMLAPADLKRFSKRIPLTWIKDACLDWAVIAASFAVLAITQNFWLILPAILIIGNRQHALALLGHDGTHFTICYDKRLNDGLNDLLAWMPLGLTGDGYRNLHLLHHRDLGTAQDPEIVYKGLRANQWDLPNRLSSVLKLAVGDLVGGGVIDYKIIFQYSKPTKSSSYVMLGVWHATFNAALIGLGLWWVALLWYVSLLTSFIMFFRLRMWIEHQETDTTQRLHLNWWQGPLLAPHKSWHHWEHHFWPSIPYARLSEIRKLISNPPAQSLSELIRRYETCEVLPSGTSLKDRDTQVSVSPCDVDADARA
ncbi:fatty acid desaturase [Asticcacaulis machinosus]|uniref:Fatty acid desaturase n=1 Tax=Asticcacaulis machinosus TaxID=2984211 RepID=A0ABT5HG20_9CAUL|nr:fatty acid desaturase [Asticcacaulis machinosus]MDC7675200.1 fatty acid desaturase [Asticcacaulis machinosus]